MSGRVKLTAAQREQALARIWTRDSEPYGYRVHNASVHRPSYEALASEGLLRSLLTTSDAVYYRLTDAGRAALAASKSGAQ